MNEPLDLTHIPDAPRLWSHWLDVFDRLIERLYASPDLYRWSLRNPLTRWVTRRRTQKLFDLMAGFVHSQVLLACVRLDLFHHLHQAPADLSELSGRINLPAPVLQRLLLSAVALGLLEHRNQGRFGLGPLGAPIAAHQGIALMIEHNHLLYEDMRDPLGFLQNAWQGSMAEFWPYAQDPQATQRNDLEKFSRYSMLMDASQDFVVQEILASYDFSEHRCVLDVGASKGRFVRALAVHSPHLQFKLFDLPPVLALARIELQAGNLEQRAQFHPGSFLHDPLPGGADLVTLIRVAHDHPDRVLRQILQKIHDALPIGGTLLLSEPMAHTPDLMSHPTGQSDAYFHFYLLAMGAGRLRTPGELRSLMEETGFTKVELVPNAMPIHTRILIGRKLGVFPINHRNV